MRLRATSVEIRAPADSAPPPYEVLAALVASLRQMPVPAERPRPGRRAQARVLPFRDAVADGRVAPAR